MSRQQLRNRNILVLLASLLVIVLIYSIDFYKLTYRMQGWKKFGETPISASQIQYFVPDTPSLIGFRDPETGESVTCGAAVAYLRTAANETYRCCDTGKKISCLAGDFSSEIPIAEEGCTNFVREAFGVPIQLTGSMDYQVFGDCTSAITASGVTVAQLDSNGRILWKTINSSPIVLLTSVLRCILAPLLFALVLWMVIIMVRARKNEPIPRY